MSLKERLMDDLKTAMREKDSIRKDAIQLSRASVLQIEKDNKIILDDDGVIEIIAKEVKKRKDSLPEYEKSGRQDLIETLKAEITVLSVYLPEPLSSEELEVLVKEALIETGASSARDMGKIMQVVLPKVKGRADGKMVNEIFKKLIG